MANFHNLETNEPIATMYIGSSRKGNIVLSHPNGTSMRVPDGLVKGTGVEPASLRSLPWLEGCI